MPHINSNSSYNVSYFNWTRRYCLYCGELLPAHLHHSRMYCPEKFGGENFCKKKHRVDLLTIGIDVPSRYFDLDQARRILYLYKEKGTTIHRYDLDRMGIRLKRTTEGKKEDGSCWFPFYGFNLQAINSITIKIHKLC